MLIVGILSALVEVDGRRNGELSKCFPLVAMYFAKSFEVAAAESIDLSNSEILSSRIRSTSPVASSILIYVSSMAFSSTSLTLEWFGANSNRWKRIVDKIERRTSRR